MEIQKIEINGVEHPMFMSVNAIHRILEAMGWDEFTLMQEASKPVVLLKLSKYSAFHAIANGYRLKGEESPFETPEELVDAITSFEVLQPAVDLFSNGCIGFFTPKGATKTATLPKAGRQTRSR